jgi:hypothetical protein
LGVKAWPAVLARGMLGMLRYDATATLKTIPVPTLVIAGDRDPVCKPEASHRMRQDIAGSQRVVLTPAKHMGLIERQERFAEVVGQFAQACLQPQPPASPGAVNPPRADLRRAAMPERDRSPTPPPDERGVDGLRRG